VNGNGTRLERVQKKETKKKKKKLLREDMPLTEGKQEKKKRIVNVFAEDKEIEVR
jgi:hypothetical protein